MALHQKRERGGEIQEIVDIFAEYQRAANFSRMGGHTGMVCSNDADNQDLVAADTTTTGRMKAKIPPAVMKENIVKAVKSGKGCLDRTQTKRDMKAASQGLIGAFSQTIAETPRSPAARRLRADRW